MAAKVDTYGLEIKGLRKACGETCNYGWYSGHYVDIHYDRGTGEVWADYHYDLGHSWHNYYHNPNIIRACTTAEHMTMQDIADAIAEELKMLERVR